MNKEDILKILEGAKDKNGEIPMRLVRQAFEKLSEPCGDTISRQAAIEVIDAVFPVDPMKSEYAQGIACGAALAKTYVKQLPSAQPEIIRCKDCRYYQDNNDGYPHINCKWDANETPDADDFCSGAERRTDE